MSVTTIDTREGFTGYAPVERTGKGFFQRLADRFIEARMRAAEHRVRQHLRTLDKATLKSLKFSDAEIARLQISNI